MELTGLRDRPVLVTGAAQGLGRAVAQVLVDEGARVGLVDRDEALLAQAAADLAERGSRPAWRLADLRDVIAVRAAVDEIGEELGGLGGLANCAGINSGADGAAADVDVETFDDLVGVNLRGTFLVCKHALPHLLAAGAATIVNISSAGALPGIKNGGATAYNAGKAGIIGLTRAIASQYAERNVRCVSVCPGPMNTPMLARARAKLGDEAIFPPRTLQRIAPASEIASVVAFLLSDLGAFVSGSTWGIDGNMTGY